jgi:hypothetical protein
MANSLTDFGRELFLAGSLSWNTGTVFMSFIANTGGTGYAGASAAVTAPVTGYKSTINSGSVLQNLYPWSNGAAAYGTVTAGGNNSPTVGSGIAGASDTIVNAVPSGSASGTVSAILLWTPATLAGVGSPIIAWIDTAASGLPIVPNGGNITVSWSRGTNLIFKL